jgi:predicted transcriptional regulator
LEKNKYISNFEYINYAREILDLAALVERLTIKAALVQKDKKNKIYSNIITLLNTIESLEKRLLKKIIEDLNKL